MLEFEYDNGRRFSVSKGSYNLEAQRKMFPANFVLKPDVHFLAVRVGDDRAVQGICADLDASFDAPTIDPIESSAIGSTVSPTIVPTLDPTFAPTIAPTVDPTTQITTPAAPSRAPTDSNYTYPPTTTQPSLFPALDLTSSPSLDSTRHPTTEPTVIAQTPGSTLIPSTNPTTDSITLNNSGATTILSVVIILIFNFFNSNMIDINEGFWAFAH